MSKKTITSLRTAKTPLRLATSPLKDFRESAKKVLPFVPGFAGLGAIKGASWLFGGGEKDDFGRDDAQADIDKYKGQLEGMSTENLYKDVESRYKDIQTDFENVYEESQVATGAADYERQMFQQSQADTMQQLRGSAGGSGVAGLAQQMANMGAQQSQRIAAGLQQQEMQANIRKQRGAEQVQTKEQQAELMKIQFEDKAEGMRLAGAADARNLEYQKVQGMLAMAAGEKEAAMLAEQQDKSWWERTFSDRRLKKNIKVMGKSPSGLNIYNFEYKDSKFGKGVYQGVMSDEIPYDAVTKHSNSYDMVNYNKIDVDFIKIKN